VDRFCDIVMEGGITSGIIYTTAVAKLARHYRFQGIAGSSIGAFAAALTAAAELQRRQGSTKGFDEIAAIPAKLAEVKGGRTLLERLFNPQLRTRRLFEVFRAGLGRTSGAKAVWFAALDAQRQYRSLERWIGLSLTVLLLAGPLVGLLLSADVGVLLRVANVVSWLGAVLLVWLVAAIGGTLAGLLGDLRRGFIHNGFGLCRGWGEKPSGDDLPDLCGFLHAAIQKAAGRDPERDLPLTFRDLWDAPGASADMLGFAGQVSGDATRSIDLQVLTTNLAHGRLYRFPLDDSADPRGDEDMGRLFFRAEELRRYFPEGLVKYLVAMSRPYAPRTASDPPAVGPGFFELPSADLPVVVAVRLAMSFPGLISALPLHAIDYGTRGTANRVLRRCWMSDGGLCSNFPIHLFDSWIPAWPTFGIALMSRNDPAQRPPVWLPSTHRQGRGDLFDGRLDGDRPAFSRLGGFIALIWMAAWRWNDRTMMRMPGVRDRVVRVFLLPNEGGINIRMSHDDILALARNYGEPAADAFIHKFAAAGSVGWSEHRWVRFMVLLTALRERVEGIHRGAAMDRYTVPLAQQFADAVRHAPLRGGRPPDDVMPSERPIEPDEAQELRDMLAAFERLQHAFAMALDAPPYVPMPRARLRLRHPS
jgi:predicted acylesterase/phospholipase RssA